MEMTWMIPRVGLNIFIIDLRRTLYSLLPRGVLF